MQDPASQDEFAARRDRMVRTQVQARGVTEPAVLAALRRVPRHRFAPHLSAEEAYADSAFALPAGQTISQPFIVARMSELLGVRPGMRVLEVGTGSGYQAAVLLELGAELVTVERLPELADHARGLLRELYPQHRWVLHLGDGTLGYPPAAPYDRVVITAAAAEVPPALLAQLTPHGRLVAPLGFRERQHLFVVKRGDTGYQKRQDIRCRFVPLVVA